MTSETRLICHSHSVEPTAIPDSADCEGQDMKLTEKMTKGICLAVLALPFFASQAFAQGTWTTQAPMPTPQDASVAGVINGQLYVVDGNTSGGVASPAYEAYNPATNTWTTTASAPTFRA